MSDERSDLEDDLEQTRQHLGETVDALSAKLDVKTRAQDAYAEADKRRLGAAAAVVVAAVVGAVTLRRRRS